MKIAISTLAFLLVAAASFYLLHSPIHSAASSGASNGASNGENRSDLIEYFHGSENDHAQGSDTDELTFSLRQNDYDLCTDQFYVDIYELTAEEFAGGANQVVLADYQEKIFNYVRTTETFHYGDREDWVEHIKDIPAQLVDIIGEDPAVIDSCANFSVALVGPP